MSPDPAHEAFMGRALDLARGAWGTTAPNPMVGAVIVEDGRIAAEGATAPDGGPHAERRALAALGRPPKPGATLYVTLEPCSTHGRTGACTEAILAAGIRKVVVGAKDPFPAHAGRGYDVLRAAGAEVVEGVREAECRELNLIFNHWAATGRPLIAGKAALTLDGRMAARGGDSRWITGEAARADAHRWRRLFPAIAVGAGTVERDDPSLTARLPGAEPWCPVRFVFDGKLRTAERLDAKVYSDPFRARTVVVAVDSADPARVRALEAAGARVWRLEAGAGGAGWAAFGTRCAQERISGVLVEGGAGLLSDALRAGALDYLFAYHGALLIPDAGAQVLGGLRVDAMAGALRLAEVRHAVLGDDVLTRGRLVRPVSA